MLMMSIVLAVLRMHVHPGLSKARFQSSFLLLRSVSQISRPGGGGDKGGLANSGL